jgi:hypothetical protein
VQAGRLVTVQAISTTRAKNRGFELSPSMVSLLNSTNDLINRLQVIGAVAVEPIDWSKGTAARKIYENLKKSMPPNLDYTSPIDFLMVVGDGRDDEVIFRWANDLDKDSTVANVTTVSLGSRNTEAGYTLTQGVTGTFPTPFDIRSPLITIRGFNRASKASYALVVVA